MITKVSQLIEDEGVVFISLLQKDQRIDPFLVIDKDGYIVAHSSNLSLQNQWLTKLKGCKLSQISKQLNEVYNSALLESLQKLPDSEQIIRLAGCKGSEQAGISKEDALSKVSFIIEEPAVFGLNQNRYTLTLKLKSVSVDPIVAWLDDTLAIESVFKLVLDDHASTIEWSSDSKSEVVEDSIDISIGDQVGTKQLTKAGHLLRVRAGHVPFKITNKGRIQASKMISDRVVMASDTNLVANLIESHPKLIVKNLLGHASKSNKPAPQSLDDSKSSRMETT